MALTKATNEALWSQGLISELGIKQDIMMILSDS